MSKYKYVIFDLDGTLFDPKLGITKSVQHALKKVGIEEPNLDNLTRFIGPPIQVGLQKYYHLSEEKAWEATAYFREYLLDYGMYEYKLYGGIKELLTQLQKQTTIYIATMKPAKYAKPILKHFALNTYFTDVFGPNLQGDITEKVHLITEIMQLYPKEKNRLFVMIGDKAEDINAANLAQIDSIAVLFGYGTKEELQKSNPTYYAENVYDLEKLLLTSN